MRDRKYIVDVTRTYEVVAESMTEATGIVMNDEAPQIGVSTSCEELIEDDKPVDESLGTERSN